MSLETQTLLELMMKKKVLEMIIEQNSDDPRVGEPKRQLALIEAELEKRKNEDAKPKNNEDEDGNLTVGLKTLRMKSSNKLR